jgi:tetratricopeptide (TPR) repeat protein
LKFSARIFPDSSSTHVNLGDVWESCGHRQQALESYRLALEKDPMNADALWKLNRLSGSSPA